MDNVVEVIRERTGAPRINLMGICMGGTFSVIYAALHPEKERDRLLVKPRRRPAKLEKKESAAA